MAGSTSHRAAEVAELVARTLEVSAARAEQARQRSRTRSDRIRAGIVQAIGAVPVDTFSLVALVHIVERRIMLGGPAKYGLERLPSPRHLRCCLSLTLNLVHLHSQLGVDLPTVNANGRWEIADPCDLRHRLRRPRRFRACRSRLSATRRTAAAPADAGGVSGLGGLVRADSSTAGTVRAYARPKKSTRVWSSAASPAQSSSIRTRRHCADCGPFVSTHRPKGKSC